MSDYTELLEGLRKTVPILELATGKPMDIPVNPNGYHAANVIEALRAENERLQWLLDYIEDYDPEGVKAAHEALERKPE